MVNILKKVTRKFKKLLVVLKNLVIILANPAVLAEMMREDGYGSTARLFESEVQNLWVRELLMNGNDRAFLYVPKSDSDDYQSCFNAALRSNRPGYIGRFINKTRPNADYLVNFFKTPGTLSPSQVGKVLWNARKRFVSVVEQLAEIEVNWGHSLNKLICTRGEKTETIQPVSPVDKVTAFYLNKAINGIVEEERCLVSFWLWVAKKCAKETGDTTSVYYSNLEEYSKRVKPKTQKQWLEIFRKPVKLSKFRQWLESRKK